MARVNDAWHALPDHVRAAILAVVEKGEMSVVRCVARVLPGMIAFQDYWLQSSDFALGKESLEFSFERFRVYCLTLPNDKDFPAESVQLSKIPLVSSHVFAKFLS